jgi:hypothetical protein
MLGAGRWLDHVHKVYPEEAEHIIQWLAHRVQRPQEKINHALVLIGHQGIGKDTLLEPVKTAVGPWNFTADPWSFQRLLEIRDPPHQRGARRGRIRPVCVL